jgi:hypothetical protein
MATGFSADILELTDNLVDVIFNREIVRPIKTYYPEICTEITLSTPTGTLQQLGGLPPAAVKHVGDNIPFDSLVIPTRPRLLLKRLQRRSGDLRETC